MKDFQSFDDIVAVPDRYLGQISGLKRDANEDHATKTMCKHQSVIYGRLFTGAIFKIVEC